MMNIKQRVPRSSMARQALNSLTRFRQARNGNVAIVFALSFIPIVGVVGIAIDYNSSVKLRGRLQDATDSAALFVAKSSATDRAERKAIAQSIIDANLGGSGIARITSFKESDSPNTVKIATAGRQKTTFLRLLGKKNIRVSVASEIVADSKDLEIALVVDNSSSMRDNGKIDSLEMAAKSLVTRLFTNKATKSSTKVAIVPFSTLVNVGPNFANARWIDHEGRSPAHADGLYDGANRFDLLGLMSDTSWKGCVEARPNGFDVTDEPPRKSDPASLYVPSFAPDERDNDSDYDNSYIKDQSSAIGRIDELSEPLKSTIEPYWPEFHRYYGSTPLEFNQKGWLIGPNFGCNQAPIQPLTKNTAKITAAIDAMSPRGSTNMIEAVAWGWRVLSPGAPFKQGNKYNPDQTVKVILMLSDGANFYDGDSTPEMSRYGAYNYTKYGRLGVISNDSDTLEDAMNKKMLEVCNNAKKEHIIIYTVAFDLTEKNAVNLLQNCATSGKHAFNANDATSLVDAFGKVNEDLLELRIVR